MRECVIDGEACVVDAHGTPSFGALQEWLSGNTKHAKIGYAAFDLLWLDGRDLRDEPIEARRELLDKLVDKQGAPLSFSRSVEGSLADLLQAAKAAGMEGLVAKRKGSKYVSGRTTSWLEAALRSTARLRAPRVHPARGDDERSGRAGARHRGRQASSRTRGRVGTGFDARTRRDLAKKLDASPADAPQADGVPRIKDAHWVVAQARRRSRLHQLDPRRVDAAPAPGGSGSAMTRRRSTASARCPKTTRTPRRATRKRRNPPRRRAAPATQGGEDWKLSNPDKVLFPRDGITKRHIWDYYTAIAPLMLPHLAGRPLTLQRYPDGIDGEEWYQQNAPDKLPPFVRLVDVGPRHDNKLRIACDNVETLQWLANLAALTIHQWVSHVPAAAKTRAAIDHCLARPDYFVLDLDPGDGPWTHLVEVAHAVRALLEALKLESFVKTSGKRGLHVVVPIAPGPSHAEATGFAERVASAVAKVLPDVATVERMKNKRHGKLYVDFGQNGEGRTIVAPYTIRARDGAVVSTPILWDEVTEELDPTKFTIRSVLDRVAKKGDLFAGVLASDQKLR